MTKYTWAALGLLIGLLTYACGGNDPQAAATAPQRPTGTASPSLPVDVPPPADTVSVGTSGMPANIEVIGDDEPLMEGSLEAEMEADMDNFLEDLDKELEADSKAKDNKTK
jgi:hypothetical protein